MFVYKGILMKIFVNNINSLSKSELKLMNFLNAYNVAYSVENYCDVSDDDFIKILRASHGYDEIIQTKKNYDHLTQHEVYTCIQHRKLRLKTPIALDNNKVTFGTRQKRRWVPRNARKIEQLQLSIQAAVELGLDSDDDYDDKVERELRTVETRSLSEILASRQK